MGSVMTRILYLVQPISPKDRFITIYGRKPVLAALEDPALTVDKVIMADNAGGSSAQEILTVAAQRNVLVTKASAQRVKVLAGNGKQDQGVLADIVVSTMRTLTAALSGPGQPASVLLLDGITTPANVGMILRTATAAGIDGIVVPRHGVAKLDPLVVKASAGVAFQAPILRCSTAQEAAEQLSEAGYLIAGMAAKAKKTIFEAELPRRVAFVLGGETFGLSAKVANRVRRWVSIPMANGVESLNVASAAAVLCFELVRRKSSG